MPAEWEGHPLRKDYPLRGPARERTPRPSFALKSNVAAGTPASGRTAAALQEQVRAASVKDDRVTAAAPPLAAEVVDAGDGRMIISMGPQHPSTHGVLQMVIELDGETVVQADPEIGYLHTGIEKSAENLFWTQASTVIERMDYLSPLSNACCFSWASSNCSASARDSGARATARVLLCELHRIASHCVWLGTGGIDLGAISGFFYASICANDSRPDRTLGRRADASELSAHRRLSRRFADGFLRKLDALIAMYYPRHARTARAAAEEPDLAGSHDRCRHPRCRRRDRLGDHGPGLRATGVPTTFGARFRIADTTVRLRRRDAYEGDAYARFMVRLDEMDQSMRIIEQARQALDTPGPVMIADTKFAPAAQRDDRALDGSADPPLQDRSANAFAFRRATSISRRGPRGDSGTTSSPTAITGPGACAPVRPRCTICKC